MTVYGIARAIVRLLTDLLYATSVRGQDLVPPRGGLVVAANHRSYLDPPILGSHFPRPVHFMTKRELFSRGVSGRLLRSLNAFPVDRERADLGSIREALKLLRAGEVVGIFPEGTRNRDGAAEARGGAVLLAATAHCPLLPVALVGTKWAARRFRASKVEVRIGQPMTFEGRAKRPTKAEIAEWTERLADAIAALGGSE